MKKKDNILFVNQEFDPYTKSTEVSKLTHDLAVLAIKNKKEIRNFMPRFGEIKERKHSLHEVIRLTKDNIMEIGGEIFVSIVKVGNVSNFKIQTYFVDNEDFYLNQGITDENNCVYENSAKEIVFNAKSVFDTVARFWEPDIIHINGWLSALHPLYLKKHYNEHPIFGKSKVVVSLIDDEFNGKISKDTAQYIAEDEIFNVLPDNDLTYVDLMKIAIDYADAIVVLGDNINPEILSYAKESGKHFVDYDDKFSENCVSLYSQLLS